MVNNYQGGGGCNYLLHQVFSHTPVIVLYSERINILEIPFQNYLNCVKFCKILF